MLLLDIIRHKKAERMGAKARQAHEAFVKYQEMINQEDNKVKEMKVHSNSNIPNSH